MALKVRSPRVFHAVYLRRPGLSNPLYHISRTQTAKDIKGIFYFCGLEALSTVGERIFLEFRPAFYWFSARLSNSAIEAEQEWKEHAPFIRCTWPRQRVLQVPLLLRKSISFRLESNEQKSIPRMRRSCKNRSTSHFYIGSKPIHIILPYGSALNEAVMIAYSFASWLSVRADFRCEDEFTFLD